MEETGIAMAGQDEDVEEETSDFAASNDVEESEPLTATAYVPDEDGELVATDVEVARPKPRQSEFKGIEQEEHDGRPVSEHEVSITGKMPVQFSNTAAREWFQALRIGQKGMIVIGYEVGQDGHRPVVQDGTVVGVARFRKLKLTGMRFPENADELEGLPLFEHGEGANDGDNIPEDIPETPAGALTTTYADDAECFCGHLYLHHDVMNGDKDGCRGCDCGDFDPLEREADVEPEDASDLEESLGIALAPTPEVCGKLHRGHRSPCPFPAADCDLEGVEASA